MSEKVDKYIEKLFEKHRIVFWHDTKSELRDDFDVFEMPGIEKVEVKNNEYQIKYQMLREQPDSKFLVYREGETPARIDNWLLDLELAHGEFRTDKVAIWLSEYNLGSEFSPLFHEHAEFFNAAKRREALKKMLTSDDTEGMIRLKMTAVCAAADPRFDDVLEILLDDLANDKDTKLNLICRLGLDSFFWQQLSRLYGYTSDTPGLKDFAIELFASCFAQSIGEEPTLGNETLVFLKRWKDNSRRKKAFETLSAAYSKDLEIVQKCQNIDFQNLIEVDYFEIVERKILSDLVKQIADKTISVGDCETVIRERRQSHWYENYNHEYAALEAGVRFLYKMDAVQLDTESTHQAVEAYAKNWYSIDQLYRKYIYNMKKSAQVTLMQDLTGMIENAYSNVFLLQLNNNWQQVVDQVAKWEAGPVRVQNAFFKHIKAKYLDADNRIFVIISDALRYEVGHELVSRIRQEDRYQADLTTMLSMLPSYTQLGMAALLPHDELAFAENGSGAVMVDGQSSQGTENRRKILQKAVSVRSDVITADKLLAMNRDESRAFAKDNDIVYVYHDRIDAAGGQHTEENIFEAAEDALDELLVLIKKLNAANVSHIIVTADHGFIYQDRAIDESDYLEAVDDIGKIDYHDRRFILGKGLKDHPGLKRFAPKALDISGDIDIMIPKSINRIRKKGSGTRYVHGGASLQEVVLPVIHVHKKRTSDIKNVEVDIISGSNNVISTGQLAVTFYQQQPVSDKVQPRVLYAGLYTLEGQLISEEQEMTFDFSSENGRERELKMRFLLSREADKVNDQEVILNLKERIADTSRTREYKSTRYILRKTFETDFDF